MSDNNRRKKRTITSSLSSMSRSFSVAPMMNCTDRHFRFFMRQMSRRAILYTEMVTTGAILFGKGYDYLAFNDEEHPLVLQLGGRDPYELALCAKIAQDRGYDEINLNVGCPSIRVKNGRFCASLMYEKDRVASCIASMREAVELPITVKTRIGIDDHDSYEFLYAFIDTVSTLGGCKTFIIHARKAWLNGLSPKDNRTIPPLDYDRVYKLKKDFPRLNIIINGGIKTIEDVRKHMYSLDGVMIGREVYKNPYILSRVDRELFGDTFPIPTQSSVIDAMLPYIDKELCLGTDLVNITRHMLGLFHGMPGSRQWRRYLSEHVHRACWDSDILTKALLHYNN